MAVAFAASASAFRAAFAASARAPDNNGLYGIDFSDALVESCGAYGVLL